MCALMLTHTHTRTHVHSWITVCALHKLMGFCSCRRWQRNRTRFGCGSPHPPPPPDTFVRGMARHSAQVGNQHTHTHTHTQAKVHCNANIQQGDNPRTHCSQSLLKLPKSIWIHLFADRFRCESRRFVDVVTTHEHACRNHDAMMMLLTDGAACVCEDLATQRKRQQCCRSNISGIRNNRM